MGVCLADPTPPSGLSFDAMLIFNEMYRLGRMFPRDMKMHLDYIFSGRSHEDIADGVWAWRADNEVSDNERRHMEWRSRQLSV